MKPILASALVLMAATSGFADDALIIIREYRPHCRSRITEITRIPKIEPIGSHVAPQRFKFAETGWKTDNMSLSHYLQWLQVYFRPNAVPDRRDNGNP